MLISGSYYSTLLLFLLCVQVFVSISFASSREIQIRKRELNELVEDVPLLYTEIGDTYRIYQKKLSWKDAIDFCSSCGMSFATFENQVEAAKVRDFIYSLSEERNESGLDRYWFGLIEEESNLVGDHMIESGNASLEETDEQCLGLWEPNDQIDKENSLNDLPKYYYICHVQDLEKAKEMAETEEKCKSFPIEKTPEPLTLLVKPEETEEETYEVDCPFQNIDKKRMTEKWKEERRSVGLKWHNIFREWHGVEPLKMDDNLTKSAQLDAEEMICSGSVKLGTTGQNIFMTKSKESRGDKINAALQSAGAVIAWYRDACDIKENKDDPGDSGYLPGEISHYTQVIWKSTKKLGIGVAINDQHTQVIMVAKYDPVQVQEEFKENYTSPRCGERSYCRKKNLKLNEPDEVRDLCPVTK